MKPLMVSTGDALSCDPRDVVAFAVGVLAGAVPLDQRAQRVGHRLARQTGSAASRCLTISAICCPVRAVDPVDLFDQLAVPASRGAS